MRKRCWTLLVVAGACAAGCTLVKPVTCTVVHPIRKVGELFDESTAEPDEVDDTPTFVGIVELPFVLPAYFVYEAFAGLIGGLGTGIVSDFNVVSGHASWDKTLENLTRPNKTNAVR